jgi:phosphoribosyl 1,2-cyclic phosphodiesterase
MRLHFLGTRGGITARSPEHSLHSSLLISFRNTSLIIDYGTDWRSQPIPQGITALLITHAHEDHSGGLSHKLSFPIYATEETWTVCKKPLHDPHRISPRHPFMIGSLCVEAIPVYHSLRAPAVGYRITGGKRSLLYVPDCAGLMYPHATLAGTDLYIGDGALVTRTLLKRTKDSVLVGHCPISEQLAWCKRYGVPRALFTHCGTEIVTSDPIIASHRIKLLGEANGVIANIAIDGMHYAI